MKRPQHWSDLRVDLPKDRLVIDRKIGGFKVRERPKNMKELSEKSSVFYIDQINSLLQRLSSFRVMIAGSYSLSSFIEKKWDGQDIDIFVPIPADLYERSGEFSLLADLDYRAKFDKVLTDLANEIKCQNNKTFFCCVDFCEGYDCYDSPICSNSDRMLRQKIMSRDHTFTVDIVTVLIPRSVMKKDMTVSHFDDVFRYILDGFDLDICRIGIVPWKQYPKHKKLHKKTEKNIKEIVKYTWMTSVFCLMKRIICRDVRTMILEIVRKDLKENGLSYDPFFNFVKGYRFNEKAALHPETNFAVMEWLPLRLFLETTTDPSLRPTNDELTVYPHYPNLHFKWEDVKGNEKLGRIKKYEERGFMIADFPSRVRICEHYETVLSKVETILKTGEANKKQKFF